MSNSDDLRDLLHRWRSGDQVAADELFRRYEQRVLDLAKRKLGKYLWRRVSPDDIMMIAMKSVLRLTAEDSCTLDQNGSLWGLVAKITNAKILKEVERNNAAKRNIRQETELNPGSDNASPVPETHEATPEEIAQVADLLEKIRSRLKPDDFIIVAMKLEGLSNPEIAEQLDVARSTITRKLKRIEDLLRHLIDEDDDEDNGNGNAG